MNASDKVNWPGMDRNVRRITEKQKTDTTVLGVENALTQSIETDKPHTAIHTEAHNIHTHTRKE